MRKLVILILLFYMILMQMPNKAGMASDQKKNFVLTGPSDVVIAANAVRVPLGRILLVRKDSEFCAVKITEFWIGKNEEEENAKYEWIYQGDKTGIFDNNVKFKKADLNTLKSYGTGRFAFNFRRNIDIHCGPIRLEWTGETWVYFYGSNQDQGDYGIELAPTIWTEISQVNVFDPRIKWYRYDEKRERLNIPIDKLWENGR